MRSFIRPLLFLIVCWAIELFFESGHSRWVFLGIQPRSLEGLVGIFTSPFIHGSRDHLISNSLPLLIVGTGMFFFYKQIVYQVTAMIWVFTGFWVWLSARAGSSHIGASGLIYGFVCFLFFSGLLRKDTRLMAVSMLVAFLYGSLVWGILPVDQSISWESHLSGSVAGIFAAAYFRKTGPQRPKAQWEIDEEMEKQQQLSQTGDEFFIHYDYIEKPVGNDQEKSGSADELPEDKQ
jgi:membrane associated rhomboid family serine protease